MYRVVERIDKRDVDNRRAIGIKFPFSSPTVFENTYRTLDMYRANILLFLSTAKRDRYFAPQIGNTIQELLFENFNSETVRTVENRVKLEIEAYFPQIEIMKVEVLSDEDHSSFQMSISFKVKNTRQESQIVLTYG